MNTTQALLERLKVVLDIDSDYALAKHLGVTRQAVSRWKNGHGQMDDTTALQIAAELGVEPMTLFARLKIERPHTRREGHVWSRYRGRLSLAVVAAIAASGGMIIPESAAAADATTYRLCEVATSVLLFFALFEIWKKTVNNARGGASLYVIR